MIFIRSIQLYIKSSKVNLNGFWSMHMKIIDFSWSEFNDFHPNWSKSINFDATSRFYSNVLTRFRGSSQCLCGLWSGCERPPSSVVCSESSLRGSNQRLACCTRGCVRLSSPSTWALIFALASTITGTSSWSRSSSYIITCPICSSSTWSRPSLGTSSLSWHRMTPHRHRKARAPLWRRRRGPTSAALTGTVPSSLSITACANRCVSNSKCEIYWKLENLKLWHLMIQHRYRWARAQR